MTKIIINKGRHYHSNWWFHLIHFFAGGQSKYRFEFSPECWYDYRNADSEDWNKLHGIRGWKDMYNEAIIVWKPNFEKRGVFRLGFYTRENRAMWFRELSSEFKVGEMYTACVRKSETGYYFQCESHSSFREHSNPDGVRSIQPYFGGNNKAPNRMSINLKKL